MALWQQSPNLEQLNAILKNTIGEQLDIRFESFDDESITASMVVDARTHQPYGLLHGGASVVLAETLGSTASHLCIDSSKFYCVGLEVNANHLRGLRSGPTSLDSNAFMAGTGTPAFCAVSAPEAVAPAMSALLSSHFGWIGL